MTSRSGTTAHRAPSAHSRARDGPATVTVPIAAAAIACEKIVGIRFDSHPNAVAHVPREPGESECCPDELPRWSSKGYSITRS